MKTKKLKDELSVPKTLLFKMKKSIRRKIILGYGGYTYGINELLLKKYFNAKFEVVQYRLEFESTRDMFRYIKKSGVSGSRKVLNYRQTKKLMNEYPVNYLEFEVVFITTR